MDIIKELAQWGFEDIRERNLGGNICFATSNDQKNKVAIKVIKKADLLDECMDRGLEIASGIQHKYIVRSLGVHQSPLVACMVTENCDANLFKYLSKTGPLSESSAKKLFSQLAEAISYLHHRINIAHGDIKCSKVLLDNNFNVKLSTFSRRIVCHYPILEYDTETLHYSAPEIIKIERVIDYKSADMFSLGVVLYVMLMATYPPRTLSEGIDFQNIFTAKVTVQFVHLMRKLLPDMPFIRHTVDQVLEHDWLKQKVKK